MGVDRLSFSRHRRGEAGPRDAKLQRRSVRPAAFEVAAEPGNIGEYERIATAITSPETGNPRTQTATAATDAGELRASSSDLIPNRRIKRTVEPTID
jgi:hypothetical protein